jgi:hypothetical protein
MQQKKPNVIIHLDVTPEESIERIKRRFVPFHTKRPNAPLFSGVRPSEVPRAHSRAFGSPFLNVTQGPRVGEDDPARIPEKPVQRLRGLHR